VLLHPVTRWQPLTCCHHHHATAGAIAQQLQELLALPALQGLQQRAGEPPGGAGGAGTSTAALAQDALQLAQAASAVLQAAVAVMGQQQAPRESRFSVAAAARAGVHRRTSSSGGGGRRSSGGAASSACNQTASPAKPRKPAWDDRFGYEQPQQQQQPQRRSSGSGASTARTKPASLPGALSDRQARHSRASDGSGSGSGNVSGSGSRRSPASSVPADAWLVPAAGRRHGAAGGRPQQDAAAGSLQPRGTLASTSQQLAWSKQAHQHGMFAAHGGAQQLRASRSSGSDELAHLSWQGGEASEQLLAAFGPEDLAFLQSGAAEVDDEAALPGAGLLSPGASLPASRRRSTGSEAAAGAPVPARAPAPGGLGGACEAAAAAGEEAQGVGQPAEMQVLVASLERLLGQLRRGSSSSSD